MKSKFLALTILFVSCAGAYAKECDYNGQKTLLSRVVAVDSKTEDRADEAGIESVRPALALNEKEIVLTFDQGPHGAYTKNVLDILDHHCVKATFFMTGSAALRFASEVRDVAQRGHTLASAVGSPGADFDALSFEAAKAEIDKGLTAVAQASNEPAAPFVRLRTKSLARDLVSHLKEEGVSVWSFDIAAGDDEPGLTATRLANRTIARVEAAGKGVIQFHDTSKATVDALDSILVNLKLAGFKVVHVVPAASYSPKPEYLAEFSKPAPVAPAVTPSRVSHALVESVRRRTRDEGDEVQRAYRRRLRSEREAALEERRLLRAQRAREQRQAELQAARERAYQKRAYRQQRAYEERAYQERPYRERAYQGGY